jgi:hypothetical protein
MNTAKKPLLTEGIASPKLAKDQRYLTYILYLASASYDKRLCPNAGDCISYCLITKAGRGAIGGSDNAIQRARKRKSDLFFADPIAFRSQLVAEIVKAQLKANRMGLPLAIRLNGGSDLDWTDIYSQFPAVQFWEYTKRPDLAIQLAEYKNVHVTYSFNERTTNRILGTILDMKINTAMVFAVRKGKPLPTTKGNIPVVDGDLSDLRFLDGSGVIVGLRLKSLRKPVLTGSAFISE